MDTLALKLAITPLLILAISLASRRWGEAIGGWLVGLPITSGPVAFFLALDQGTDFAEQAAAGSLAGTASQALFCIAYFVAAGHVGWPVAFALAAGAFVAGAALLKFVMLPLLGLYAMALTLLSLGIYLTPSSVSRLKAAPPPLWDIPARMLIATSLVVGITSLATRLGATLSGVLATFPVFATVLTVFAHRALGTTAARQVLRGLLMGLYCFASFFFVLSFLMPRVSLGLAFLGATVTALAVHGVAFEAMRRQRRAALPAGERRGD